MADEPLKPIEEFNDGINMVQDAIRSLGAEFSIAIEDMVNDISGGSRASEKVLKSLNREIISGLSKSRLGLDAEISMREKLNEGRDITLELEKAQGKMQAANQVVRSRIAELERISKESSVEKQEAIAETTLELKEQLKLGEKGLTALQEENKNRKAALGITGKLTQGADGILKNLDKSGNLSSILDIEGAFSGMNKVAGKFKGINGKNLSGLKKTSMVAGNIGKNLIKGFKGADPISFFVMQMVDALISSDKAAGDLAKGMDMTYQSALDTRYELTSIANLSLDSAVNTKGLQESLMAVGASLDTNAKLNRADLVTMTKMREQAGFTNEELTSLQKLSLVNGKSLEENSAEFLGQAKALATQEGIMLNEKTLLKSIKDVSNSIKISLGLSTKELAQATVEAKALGTNLETVDQISASLLDFETSIQNELSAELLLGKDINLEKARSAALNNDIASVAKEISNQIGSAAEFTKLNRIQQEALSTAVGMSREELSKSLIEREALSAIGAKDIEVAREKYNSLVATYGVEEAQTRLGDEALANQFKQQAMQEKFQQSIEKLKDIFVSLAGPVLEIVEPFADLVTDILPALNLVIQPFTWALKQAANLISWIKDNTIGNIKGNLMEGAGKGMNNFFTELNDPYSDGSIQEGNFKENSLSRKRINPNPISFSSSPSSQEAQNDNKALLNEMKGLRKGIELQQRSMNNLKVEIDTNALTVGQLQGFSKIQ